MGVSPRVIGLLDRYGFNPTRFDSQCAALRKVPYTEEQSRFPRGTRVEPMSPKAFSRMPVEGALHEQALARGEEALRKGRVAVLLLNGGMATRFGGIAKGAAKALADRSFLDLRLSQVADVAARYQTKIPVVLMNSFATDVATKEHLEQHKFFGLPKDQIFYAPQGVSIRLTPDGEPFAEPDGELSLYAPGHGDLPWALERSGVGNELRKRSIDVVFVSNVDNLGCTLDPVLVGMHVGSKNPMTAELVDRVAGDTGGAPAKVDGVDQLVEGFRLPASFDPNTLVGFNTNTFYFDWRALDARIELGFYPVQKTVAGTKVVQFERIVGELSKHVACGYVLVPRDQEKGRFLPVKTPDDLQALQSTLANRYKRGA